MPAECRPASADNSLDLSDRARFANLMTSGSLIALIAWCVLWEMWWAPLRPGGSWLVLKVLPLLAPLFGILHGRRYTHQWASLLIQLYLLEGLARMVSDASPMRWMAAVEAVLAAIFLIATTIYARLTAPSRQAARAGHSS